MSGPAAPHSPAPRPTWQQARALAHTAATLLEARTVPLAEALDCLLATDLTAPTDLPHYASSAMDGWAVAGPGPWRLGDDPGRSPETALRPGDAVPILTGGAVPTGTTAVLRSEHGRLDRPAGSGARGADLLVDTGPAPVPADAHIRPAGEEAVAGDVLIRAGEVLTPAHVALAAVVGADTLTVRPAPTVTVLLTGDEVVTSGLPAPGQVRDAFGPQVPAVVSLLGGRTTAVHRLLDDRDAVTHALTAAAADVVITTGGTGRSSADHVRSGLIDLGAELIIDGIDVRPGHPAVLARLPDGPLVVALPGNPLAAMLTLLTLAQPVLAGLRGRPRPGSVLARSTVDLPPARTTRLLPARRVPGTDGVAPCGHTGAGMLRGLADADVVLVVPARGLIAWREAEAVALPWVREQVDTAARVVRGDGPAVRSDAWSPHHEGSLGPETARPVVRVEGPRI